MGIGINFDSDDEDLSFNDCRVRRDKECEGMYSNLHNPYYPFSSEAEELKYKNAWTETICKRILRYNGKGKFGDKNLQKIAEIVFKSKNK